MKKFLKVSSVYVLLFSTLFSVALIAAQPSLPEPQWDFEHYFPRFNEPEKVYVFDVPNAMVDWWGDPSSPGWRITDSPETMDALTIVGLQGVINRYHSCIYLNWEEAEHFNDRDGFWLPYIAEHVDMEYMPQQGAEAVNYLVQTYSDLFEGAVVYDPEIPDTINVATMIAGMENRVMLSPQQVSDPGYPEFTSVVDLTETAAEEGWEATTEGRLAVYQWVYDNLWPSLEDRVIGILSTGPPNSGSIGEDSTELFPLSLAARDYAISLKLTALWLSPENEAERALLARYLEDAPSPIPVFGFVERFEEGIVDLASEYGDWVAVITNGNVPVSSGSLSCLSGIRPPIRCYEPTIDVDKIFATLGQDPILMFYTSDGDALQYVIDRGFWPGFTWDQMQGSSIGFTTNPVLMDLAPVIWNYYVESASDTALTCGFSGAGYMYPHLMSEDELAAYLEYTATYLEESGLTTIWIDLRRGEWDYPYANMYSTYLRDSGMIGTYMGSSGLGYLGGGVSYLMAYEPSMSNTYVIGNYPGDFIRENVFQRTPGELMITLGDYPWHSGAIVSDSEAASGQAAFFPATMGEDTPTRGPWAALEPGEYEVTYRMKAASNTLSSDAIEVYVGTRYQFSDWHTLDSDVIACSDFTQSDVYQDFTLGFTLHKPMSWIECKFAIKGATDLTLDYINLRKTTPPDFPVFSTVLITPQDLTDTHDTISSIEEAGGQILTPDEFFGALNPRFMIDWAHPVLGMINPSIFEANQQYNRGEYYQSLVTIRDALRDYPERTTYFRFDEGGEEYVVEITANTYITDREYHAVTGEVSFKTHGAPMGTVDMIASVNRDARMHSVEIDGEGLIEVLCPGGCPQVEFDFPQGPHEVKLTLSFNEPPIADFTWSPMEPIKYEEVQFIDESFDHNELTYHWNFGDDFVSTRSDPVHEYFLEGTYTVTLTVADPLGLEDQISKQITVGRDANLEYSDVQIFTSPIRKNRPMTVTVDCENTGGRTGTEELTLYIDGEAVETQTLTVDPGEVITASYVYTPTSTGAHTLELAGVNISFTVRPDIPGFPIPSLVMGLTLSLLIITLMRKR